ncbi:hypothetical protein HanXRQr2_Chr11g0487761 [Helianthus annuus]|uniref:Uncharacterized protein n=1 Tax=Helianthus annuus TaxID=4232 RepID=A0A251VBS9_HELAN|nr:hypothetical protein HanXRQr2_Chr11g0487761 [Helianthus annuus]KAJ0874910.1 hypothetical protein HanPSC8_Chr11g0469931 [Helianthus annuus]
MINPSHLSFIAQLEKQSLLFTDSITRIYGSRGKKYRYFKVHEAVFDLPVEIAKIRRTIEKIKEVGIYRLDTHQGCSRSLWMSVVWIQHIAMEANIVVLL